MNKKPTNISFKQGRYEASQHIDSTTVKNAKAQKGYMICTECRAVHHNKHWYTEDESLKKGLPEHLVETLCPGCSMVERNVWEGTVDITGEFEPAALQEMNNLIANIESECRQDNPASRILSRIDGASKIEIKTTSMWLAKRIGKAIEKAYGGKLDVTSLPEKPSVHVRWSKE